MVHYYRYQIDASHLDLDARKTIWDFLRNNSDVHTIDAKRPGVFEAFFIESELSHLQNPLFAKCVIKDISQQIDM